MLVSKILQKQKSLYPVFLKHAVCIENTLKYMLEHKLLQIPILDRKKFLGLVNRRRLTKIHMKQDNNTTVPVELIKRDVMVVSPTDDLSLMIGRIPKGQHIIPVVDNNKYINALTRNQVYSAILKERENQINDYERYIRGFGFVG